MNCRRCGRETGSPHVTTCNVCNLTNWAMDEVSAQSLFLIGAVVAIIVMPLLFVRTLPPWTGPGNEFAPLFNIGSVAIFGIGIAVLFLARRSIMKERSELADKLRGLGYNDSSIHGINRIVLFLGVNRLFILIGAGMILFGMFPILMAFIPLVNIDVVLPVLPLGIGSVVCGGVIFSAMVMHYRMNCRTRNSLIGQTHLGFDDGRES